MTDVKPHLVSRRQILRQFLGTSLCLPFSEFLAASYTEAQTSAPIGSAAGAPVLSAEDDQFLNDLEHASFLFFWEQGSPKTGMVKDRCNVHNDNQAQAASIAATGFGLTALCIGEQRGFISAGDALQRVFATLRFLWRKLPNHRGFFYHFANPETGERKVRRDGGGDAALGRRSEACRPDGAGHGRASPWTGQVEKGSRNRERRKGSRGRGGGSGFRRRRRYGREDHERKLDRLRRADCHARHDEIGGPPGQGARTQRSDAESKDGYGHHGRGARGAGNQGRKGRVPYRQDGAGERAGGKDFVHARQAEIG